MICRDYLQIYDAELSLQGNYNGASITLARHGSANSEDIFSSLGNLSFNGGNALLSGVAIATIENSNGMLTMTFNNNATQSRINEALSSLAYSNASDNPPVSVTIDWTFSDGNTGIQGTGGALVAMGSTTVTINAINDAPSGTDKTLTLLQDSSLTLTATDFGFSDVDGNSLLAVKISSLPLAGSLKLNNNAITVNTSVSVADINAGKLVYMPAAHANGNNYANFSFQVQDNGGTLNGGVDTDSTPNTLTVNVTAVNTVNDAPSGTDKTITFNEDTSYILTIADFGFTDPNDTPANSLLAVKISSLPIAGNLKLNGVAVTTGQFVAVADITANKLSFTPASNANGANYASFGFQVQDNGGTANGGVDLDPTTKTLTFNVVAFNHAPSGTDKTITLNEDSSYTFTVADFGFTDPNDNPANSLLAIKLTTLPVAGTVTLNGVAVSAGQFITVADINSGLLKFTPVANVSGNNFGKIAFQVRDNGGTANGGIDLDPSPNTLTLNVTTVNDAPAFEKGTGIIWDNNYDYYVSNALQKDGKILLVGYGVLNRYNSDGSFDNSFSGDGRVGTGISGRTVAIQTDGKILVAGSSGVNWVDFALVRYNSDGSLDNSFNGNGKVTTAGSIISNSDTTSYNQQSVAVQSDGKILLVGSSSTGTGSDFAIVRYNTNGSLDTSFSGDGIVTTDFNNSLAPDDYAESVIVQSDGKILVVGIAGYSLALVRYNSDGTLDNSFGGTGKVTTNILLENVGADSKGFSVTLQTDGKILVVGRTGMDYPSVLALVRYNSDGTLDTSFDSDGIVTSPTDWSGSLVGYSVAVQTDGKILAAGLWYDLGSTPFPFTEIFRYNSDGSLDSSFGKAGMVKRIDTYASSISIQTDGKIILAGSIDWGGANLVRLNSDGSLDTSFGVKIPDATVSYTEKGIPVLLDSTVHISDSELASLDNYNGASISLSRHGGANSQDVFSGFGNLSFNANNALLSAVNIGSVLNNNGMLTLTFNNNATQARVNEALSSLAYSNTSNNPATSIQIDWTFNDGNTGAQGAGGALTATGITTVNITPWVNHEPSGADSTVTIPKDIPYILSTANFGFTDPNETLANSLLAVKINSLPITGSLKLDGVAVTAGQFVAVADIIANKLSFIPASNINGANYASFDFQVQDNGGKDYGGVDLDSTTNTLTFNVVAFNHAPSGTDKTITLNEDSSYTFTVADFGFSDPDDNPANSLLAVDFDIEARYGITLNGESLYGGYVTVADINAGLLKFTPGTNTNGNDYHNITFQVQDNGGRTSSGEGGGSGNGIDLDPTPNTLTFNVLPVNDAPIFVAGTGEVHTNVTSHSLALQYDGKIFLAGSTDYYPYDFALTRYNSNGTLDTSFSGNGIVTTDFNHNVDQANSFTIQADGKILLAGTSGTNNLSTDQVFALARYNTDGSLDASFNGNGMVTTVVGSYVLGRNAVTLQTDGKILVAGSSFNGHTFDFAVVRYNTNGSLDTSFSNDGIVTTNFARLNEYGESNDYAESVIVQSDGKILVAGSSSGLFALARYNSNGTLDTSFDNDGEVILPSSSIGHSVTLQTDGKILVVGEVVFGIYSSNLVLVRYNSNGSLDTSFDGDGKVTLSFNDNSIISGLSVTVQTDGKILVAGFIRANEYTYFGSVLIARYNTNGFLDTSFGHSGVVTWFNLSAESISVQTDGKILVAGGNSIARFNTDGSPDITFGDFLPNATSNYTEKGSPVLLDSTVHISDIELTSLDNYNGASISLSRHGGANSQDVFSGFGNLSFNGNNALLSAVNIGSVLNNNGMLTLTFNNNATQERVNEALSSLAYSNTSNNPATSIQIDWTFNDGNTGAQGAGGALTATGITTVNIIANNTQSVNHEPSGLDSTITILEDTAYTFTTTNFGFTDPNDNPANTLLAVKIPTLPTAGSLTLNGVTVTTGQSVAIADINAGKLIFTSATHAIGTNYANFTFQVQDNGGTANGGIDLDQSANTLNINVVAPNTAPVAVNDSLNATEDTPAKFTAAQLLGNDTDVNGDTLSIAQVTSGTGGAVVLNQDGTVSFTPTANFNGVANFSYQASDGKATSNTATVSITVASVNDAPVLVIPISNQTANSGQAFSFTVPTNSFNDVDSGDVLSYQATQADGSVLPAWLTFNTGSQTFSGTPAATDISNLQLKVIATDKAGASASGLFALGINQLQGGSGNDTLSGGNSNDIMFGGAGNDSFTGGAGNDQLNGGFGFDIAHQTGAFSDYRVETSGNTVILTNNTSGERDTFVDVERVSFDSGSSLYIAYSKGEAVAEHLITTWLHRDLSVAEGVYVQEHLAKATSNDIVNAFLTLPEAAGLQGKTAGELLAGLDSNSHIIQIQANRDIVGSNGNDQGYVPTGLGLNVDGGAGFDVLHVHGASHDTHVEINGNKLDVTQLTDGSMVSLKNVEMIAYDSGDTVAIAHNNSEGILGRLVHTFLNHNASVQEWQSGQDALAQHVDPKQILDWFQAHAGLTQLNNSDYVNTLYQNTFQHQASATQLHDQVARLDSGAIDRSWLAVELAQSQEAVTAIGSVVVMDGWV